MHSFAIEKKGAKGEFIMSGALTIDNSAEIKAKLIEMLKKTDRIVIRINKESEIDVSVLQLLCSAHQTAMISKKSLVVDYTKSDNLINTIRDAGYVRTKGCFSDMNDNCLWINKG